MQCSNKKTLFAVDIKTHFSKGSQAGSSSKYGQSRNSPLYQVKMKWRHILQRCDEQKMGGEGELDTMGLEIKRIRSNMDLAFSS